jgi:integrase
MYPKAEPWTWRLYPDKRGGWTLKYRDENGVRHEHTVPPKFKDERPAKKYAVIWMDERKKIAAEKKAAHSATPPPPSNTTTFEQFAQRWTTGELHRLYPDHVGTKKTIDDDKQRLRDYVYPVIGDLPIAELVGAVGLERADEVMLKLPTRSPQTRRHVAQTIHRVFTMAAYPARIIPASPLPKGWLPKVKSGKARTYLYPDEDAKLLACVEVPLVYRVFFGFLSREGCRPSEALRFERNDFDIDRGAVTLDRNKTNDPRAWALSPGTAPALATWWERFRPAGAKSAVVFLKDDGTKIDPYDLAGDFRAYLRVAGVDRKALFESSEARVPVRAYDLRATFVTLSLANGKSEAWVSARTGHRSSQMINRYRRVSQSVAELNLGALLPLNEAIPELRPLPTVQPVAP